MLRHELPRSMIKLAKAKYERVKVSWRLGMEGLKDFVDSTVTTKY